MEPTSATVTPPDLDEAAAYPDPDSLVAAHLPLARYAVAAVAARTQFPPHVTREDLLSCAHVALVETARRYRSDSGATFATYALPRLQGAVLDELRGADWASRGVRSGARRAQQATQALTAELGRPPTNPEIAERLGVGVGDLEALQVDVQRAVLMSVEEAAVAERLPATEGCPESQLLAREQWGYLLDAIDALPDRLSEVIERNFFGEQTLTEIADDLGVTVSRVSQMRTEALRLLSAALGEMLHEKPAPAPDGPRAAVRQRRYISDVAGRSSDYRARLARDPRLPAPAL